MVKVLNGGIGMKNMEKNGTGLVQKLERILKVTKHTNLEIIL